MVISVYTLNVKGHGKEQLYEDWIPISTNIIKYYHLDLDEDDLPLYNMKFITQNEYSIPL